MCSYMPKISKIDHFNHLCINCPTVGTDSDVDNHGQLVTTVLSCVTQLVIPFLSLVHTRT